MGIAGSCGFHDLDGCVQWCRGRISVAPLPARRASPRCTSPPHVADPLDYVFIEASNNDQQFTREGAMFDYYPAPNVTAVIPSTAPKRGNTLITVAPDAGLKTRIIG